jgi:hypothetical protein
VTDLAVSAVTTSSAVLTFTEVSDGAGHPASYDVRFYDVRSAASPLAWVTATEVSRGSCAAPLAGTRVGTRRTCTVEGLTSATTYGFQVVAFRGTLGVNAVFGGLSNVASGSTWATVDTLVVSTRTRVMRNVFGDAVTWTASAGSITASGLYTAPASPGQYQVCAQAPGFLACELVVVIPRPQAYYALVTAAPVASVKLTPETVSAAVGQMVQMSVAIKDSNGIPLAERVVTWGTSNAEVASVNAEGLVTGVAAGRATITATAEDKSGTAAVTVTRVSARHPHAMNAADSIRVQLRRATVAVAVPVEIMQDSVVLVRLLLDPRESDLPDSLALERAAGMHVEPGTAHYSASMTAVLTTPGAEVTPINRDPRAVLSTAITEWTWILRARDVGPQNLQITLSVVGVSATGALLQVYKLAPNYSYTIRRNWRRTLSQWGDRLLWLVVAALIGAWFGPRIRKTPTR